MTDIIARAEAAMRNARGLPWSTDPSAPEPDDYDTDAWCDVDGSLGGWIAHCQDSDTAFFVACAPGLIRELVAALKAARAENERLRRCRTCGNRTDPKLTGQNADGCDCR